MPQDYTPAQLEQDTQMIIDSIAIALARERASNAPDHVDYANARSLLMGLIHEALKQPR